MYLGVDIGGTKTLIASFTKQGKLVQSIKFPTPQKYPDFIRELANNIVEITSASFSKACVAFPGRVDREKGIGVALGNLPWHNVPILNDVERLLDCPVIVENDAKLAGLSEAILLKESYRKVLYVTISTGIGTALITDQTIDPDFEDAEGGHIILEHQGKLQMWETFASGRAIVKQFGKRAEDITDTETWRTIGRNIAIGLIDLSAIIQPEVIVLGGGVGTHFHKFKAPLLDEMNRFTTPLTPVPKVVGAQRPEEAVVYGCYDLMRGIDARTITKTTT